jgi:hypothetical protein
LTGRACCPAQAQAAVQARAAEAATRDLLRAVRTFDRTQCDGLFAEPVTDDIAEGYSSIIARPVDLKTLACAPFLPQLSGACDWAGPPNLKALACEAALHAGQGPVMGPAADSGAWVVAVGSHTRCERPL